MIAELRELEMPDPSQSPGDPDRDPMAQGFNPDSSYALVQRARDGDELALNRLFDRYARRLHVWAHGRLPSWARGPADTGDLVQDTLLQVVRRLDNFVPRHEGAFLAYVRQTLRNNVINRVRSGQRHGCLEPLDSSHISKDPDPFAVTAGVLLEDRYEDALQRLRPEQRQAIIARIELQLPWAEVQAVLGKPSLAATQMYVKRALVKLALEMSHGQQA